MKLKCTTASWDKINNPALPTIIVSKYLFEYKSEKTYNDFEFGEPETSTRLQLEFVSTDKSKCDLYEEDKEYLFSIEEKTVDVVFQDKYENKLTHQLISYDVYKFLSPQEKEQYFKIEKEEQQSEMRLNEMYLNKVAEFIKKYRHNESMTPHRIAKMILTTDPNSTFYIKDELPVVEDRGLDEKISTEKIWQEDGKEAELEKLQDCLHTILNSSYEIYEGAYRKTVVPKHAIINAFSEYFNVEQKIPF